jgi:hypothetical protein
VRTTAQRVKLLDAFLAFLLVVGALQFGYCVLAGNFVRSSRGKFENWVGGWVSLLTVALSQ